MATKGKGKASKTTEEVCNASDDMNKQTLEEREHKAQDEIKIESEIRVAALEAEVPELRRVKATSSSPDDYLLPAPS